jgi:nitric oxide reductase subunit B
MFGAFGFLAIGMAAYALRIVVSPDRWDGTLLRRSFWLWNVGLALMVFVSVLPVGFLQLEAAFTQSYDAARSLAFYNGETVQLLFWARMPGDTLLILGTALFGYDVVRKLRQVRPVTSPDDRTHRVPDRIVPDDD